MKTIGILGGMSWESTAVYYKRLNELARDRLGGNSSAPVVMHSFNFAEIEELQHREDWEGLLNVLASAARGLAAAGADLLVIATNTMHLIADEVARSCGLPVLHIADAAAAAVQEAGWSRVALAGTRFTMEKPFYAERISDGSGADVVIPHEDERQVIHNIIYGELCSGVVSDESRSRVVEIIDSCADRGAEAALLACTELPLLVGPEDARIPVIDTMETHIRAVIREATG